MLPSSGQLSDHIQYITFTFIGLRYNATQPNTVKVALHFFIIIPQIDRLQGKDLHIESVNLAIVLYALRPNVLTVLASESKCQYYDLPERCKVKHPF